MAGASGGKLFDVSVIVFPVMLRSLVAADARPSDEIGKLIEINENVSFAAKFIGH